MRVGYAPRQGIVSRGDVAVHEQALARLRALAAPLAVLLTLCTLLATSAEDAGPIADAAVAIAQDEFDRGKPDVVVGSSRGGAVAMNINSGDTNLVLLCPAWKRWGAATKVKPGTALDIAMGPPTGRESLATGRSSSSAAFRRTSKTSAAATRESEHPNRTANGFCATLRRARWSTSWAGCDMAPAAKRALPASSSAQAAAGVMVCGTRSS